MSVRNLGEKNLAAIGPQLVGVSSVVGRLVIHKTSLVFNVIDTVQLRRFNESNILPILRPIFDARD